MWYIIIILLLILMYFITKERFCYRIDSLESVLHGDLSSRKYEPINIPKTSSSDLNVAFGSCWEPNQMRALIDNSPTQQAVCDYNSDCSKYMSAGYINF